jgi:hypothetical protein
LNHRDSPAVIGVSLVVAVGFEPPLKHALAEVHSSTIPQSDPTALVVCVEVVNVTA